jgi:16S rRNA (guanine527-N7)-methyltransferase
MEYKEARITLLNDGAKELGITLDQKQIYEMLTFMEVLLEWNQRINLTSITEEFEVLTKHFLDSISVIKSIPAGSETVLDIGSGGGFPGIPVQIACPDLTVFLLDSIKKKTEFLLHAKEVLKGKFNVYNMRAEDGARKDDMRESFDVVVSRAVASLPVLVEYCLPYVRHGGKFIAMKSDDVDREIENAQRAITVLGGGNVSIRQVSIPGTDIKRRLISIEKIAHTPSAYPRRAGMPEKRPI